MPHPTIVGFRCTNPTYDAPDDWNQLLAEARSEGERLQRIAAGMAQVQP